MRSVVLVCILLTPAGLLASTPSDDPVHHLVFVTQGEGLSELGLSVQAYHRRYLLAHARAGEPHRIDKGQALGTWRDLEPGFAVANDGMSAAVGNTIPARPAGEVAPASSDPCTQAVEWWNSWSKSDRPKGPVMVVMYAGFTTPPAECEALAKLIANETAQHPVGVAWMQLRGAR